ncbi:MAG: KH domain-containing protein [Clostridiales bacterium]|nr:KH domain-containing protein [Clostridiales bacterium]
MLEIISIGRKPKDAIDSGLRQLGKSLEEVEVEILDPGGLFRKAKVRIKVEGEEPTPAPEVHLSAPNKKAFEGERRSVENKRPERAERPERPAKDRTERVERTERKQSVSKAPVSKAPANENKAQEKAPENVSEKREPRRYEPVTVEVAKKAEDFITELVAKMNVQASVETSIEDGRLMVSLNTESSALIGHHGEVLDSIEYLASFVINRDGEKYYNVVVNCNGYREKRKESLVALANRMAAKCIKIRRKVVLEPMNSNERKIIHSALADNDQIITKSEGHEPGRHIVILYKRR